MSKIAFVPIIPNNFFLPTPTIFLVAAQSCKLNCILSNVYSKLQYNQTKPMIRALNNKFCKNNKNVVWWITFPTYRGSVTPCAVSYHQNTSGQSSHVTSGPGMHTSSHPRRKWPKQLPEGIPVSKWRPYELTGWECLLYVAFGNTGGSQYWWHSVDL